MREGLKFIRKTLKRHLFFTKTIVNGMSIVVPTIFRVSPDLFSDDRWLITTIEKILKEKKGAFIDIGANLGQTLAKVKSIKLDQEYYGFEPNPLCCHYANELVRANKYANSTLIPVGLSNRNGITSLFLNYSTDCSSSLISNFREKDYLMKEFVSIFKGDYLIECLNINEVSVIKIDVEGGELEVIEGIRNSISKFRPYILCEILRVYKKSGNVSRFRKGRKDKLEAILRDEKYEIYAILPEGEIVSVNALGDQSAVSLRDYIFIPVEEREKARKMLDIGLVS